MPNGHPSVRRFPGMELGKGLASSSDPAAHGRCVVVLTLCLVRHGCSLGRELTQTHPTHQHLEHWHSGAVVGTFWTDSGCSCCSCYCSCHCSCHCSCPCCLCRFICCGASFAARSIGCDGDGDDGDDDDGDDDDDDDGDDDDDAADDDDDDDGDGDGDGDDDAAAADDGDGDGDGGCDGDGDAEDGDDGGGGDDETVSRPWHATVLMSLQAAGEAPLSGICLSAFDRPRARPGSLGWSAAQGYGARGLKPSSGGDYAAPFQPFVAPTLQRGAAVVAAVSATCAARPAPQNKFAINLKYF